MATKSITVAILGTSKGLQGAVAGANRSLGTLGATAGKVGLASAAALAGIGVGAVVGLAKLGDSFDEQFDKIRVGTGATGDTLEDLKDEFKDVLTNVPASFDDAGTAIADLNTRLGLTGDELEASATQFLNLSRITGEDLGGNINNITRTFGDWGIATGDQEEALDRLYRASQASGVGVGDLSQSVVQFGAPLRNLGFDLDEATALLAGFDKAGVNTEAVMSGLKIGVGKLAKAGEDVPATFERIVGEISAMGPGTEATGLAIELFGQRAGPDLADAIAGGKFEIEDMLAAIEDGTDTINGAALDTESFGEKWTKIKNRVFVGLEPLATKVFEGVGKAMDKLGPIVTRVSEYLSENLPRAIDKLRPTFNTVKRIVLDLADGFADGVAAVRGFITENDLLKPILVGIAAVVAVLAIAMAAVAVSTLLAAAPFIALGLVIAGIAGGLYWAYENVEVFRNAVDGAVTFIKEAWPKVQKVFEDVLAVVTTVITTAVDVITKLWSEFGDEILSIVETAWDLIWTVISTITESIATIISIFKNLVTGDWDALWEDIKKLTDDAMEAGRKILKLGLELILKVVKLAFSAMWKAIKYVWNDLVLPFIKKIPGRIKDGLGNLLTLLKQKGKDILQGLLNGAKNIWTKVIDWVKERPEKVKAGIPNPGDLLKSVGKAVMQGLLDGMKSKWTGIKNWLSSRASDVAGFFTSALDVRSPSRVMHGIGINIMQGLNNGMNLGFGAVEKSMESQVAAIDDAYSGLRLFEDFSFRDYDQAGNVGGVLPESLQGADSELQLAFAANATLTQTELASLRGDSHSAATGRAGLTVEGDLNIGTMGRRAYEDVVELEGLWGMSLVGAP